LTDTSQLRVVPEPLSASPLVQDYLAQRGDAPSFFGGSPHSLASFRAKLEEVSRRFGRAERERAAAAVRPTSERAAERLRAFVERGGAMVTTGQQAGLLTGPLYTIHKALTAARLAETLEGLLGITVIPVFWVASEDHDWAEIDHAVLGISSNGTRRLSLPDPPAAPHPVGIITLGEGVRPILDELAQLLEGSPYASDILTLVRDAYQPDRTVSAAFREVMEALLSPFDMCVTDAADPVVKEVSAAVLVRALTEAPAHQALLAERSVRLAGAGYAAQVTVLEGATNVFLHDEMGRTRIYGAGEAFSCPETGRELSRDELLGLLRERPDGLSPNVLLRPIVESAVFPTLAYVGGPGEISYFAQINALFPAFHIEPPVAYPRFSATLVEAPMQRLLEKLGLGLDELARPQHELVEELAQRAMPPAVSEIIASLGESVTEGYRRLTEAASAVDPTLEEALASLRNQVLAKIGDSERKVVRQLKRKEEITVGQLERARANLRPDGEPQDRVLNVLPFIARHGPGLLQEIAAAIQPAVG
jgi:bacillithiol biosynthesis cysteine-adding enzyme BshC